ncbi:MAG TPA: aromatic-ring-hydroxylating dioxygenase subunit beta [Chloroflexota bacterium]
MVPAEPRQEIEALLYREARLLDERRFNEWLELFSDDVRYWMPAPENVQGSDAPPDPNELGFGYMDEDKRLLTMRVRRLDTGMAHVEVPASDTLHLIGNVEVEAAAEPDEMWAHSTFILRQVRRGRAESTFSGRRKDRLRLVDGTWKIAERRIYLVESLLPRVISVFF